MEKEVIISTATKLEGYEIESFLGFVNGITFGDSNYISKFSKDVFVDYIIEPALDESTRNNNELIADLSKEAIRKGGDGLIDLKIIHTTSSRKESDSYVVEVTAMCIKIKSNSDQELPKL